MSALAGRGVVITRAQSQAIDLADALRAAQAVPLQYPSLEIQPIAVAGLSNLAKRLARIDWLIFISRNAVTHGVAALRRAGVWPCSNRLAAIGPGTAAQLQACGATNVLYPEVSADTEALLARMQGHGCAGQQVLIVKGAGGRALLAEALRGRGCEVSELVCYQRVCPPIDLRPLLAQYEAGHVHALTAFSAEALGNFVTRLGPAAPALLRQLPVFTVHPRIAAEAKRLGAEQALVVPAEASAMVRALVAYFETTR